MLARLRRARAFHPRGRTFIATLSATAHCPEWLRLPREGGQAVVRLSRGIGLPGNVPDILGLAIRVAAEEPWDLLLSSSAARFPFPARAWTSAHFSTITTFIAEVVTARATHAPADARLDSLEPFAPLRFTLTVADAVVGHLVLTTATDTEIAFVPPSSGPRWLATLRRRSYVGSREGRTTR